MPLFLSPVCNDQTFDANGDPLNAGQIETYLAGSSTPAATYTDDTGATPQSNPIILNSLGYPTLGPIWLTGGVSYKFIIKDALGVTLRTIDNISGVNDASVSQSEWVESGFVPTYISATSFSVPGDQTAILQINRRLRTTNTAGFVYSTITNSVFAAGITTVTVVNTSGVLDVGLSAVAYGLLSATNPSIPLLQTAQIADGAITEPKLATNAVSTVKIQDSAITFAKLAAAAIAALTPRGHIGGLTMSTAGSSATMTVGAGQAADSTAAQLLSLSSAIAKTTSAWAVGTATGGLDTGSIANSTWYHFFIIRRPDTGVVDVLFSLSASAPTLPANYTQFRRIGSGRTNGSAQWLRFFQDGDLFQWETPLLDIDVTSPGTSAVTRTLTVPTGVRVAAIINTAAFDSSAANAINLYLSDLQVTDQAPTSGAAAASPLAGSSSQTNTPAGGFSKQEVMTNTSAQIRSRVNITSATTAVKIATLGWRDSRGRDA